MYLRCKHVNHPTKFQTFYDLLKPKPILTKLFTVNTDKKKS